MTEIAIDIRLRIPALSASHMSRNPNAGASIDQMRPIQPESVGLEWLTATVDSLYNHLIMHRDTVGQVDRNVR